MKKRIDEEKKPALSQEKKVMWKHIYHSKWALPFSIIVVFIGILSLRLLSDPDLGFHLNVGKWIVENFSFPAKDTFTFTALQNDYIDLHWLFQVIIFLAYKISGYNGLSILTAFLSMVLLYVLLRRNFSLNIPLFISCILLFTGFLIIESRLILRPEIFTFIFITVLSIILDNYYYGKNKKLYGLLVLMLLWCNMHGLFILGFAFTCSYFISIWIRDKKIDLHFLLWMSLSFAICVVNPYFLNGLFFPLELFSRFDSNNIYHQSIKEFQSFFQSDITNTKDILFLIFSICTIILTLITFSKRKPHEIIFLIVFLYLALVSIRNIPLFIIVAIPITGKSIAEIIDITRRKKVFTKLKRIKIIIYYVLIIVPLFLSLRIFTNTWYVSNGSYMKTGIGIDEFQQPEKASEFINCKKLKGNILNSIGYGGWLEWRTARPVFIDGRLEVMKEQLYSEVVKSWSNGLAELIDKYDPSIIVYNYLKYHTWTDQIAALQEWKLIYLDGATAIFMLKDNAKNIPKIDFDKLPAKFNLAEVIDEEEKLRILNIAAADKFSFWIEGFYKQVDYKNIWLLNMASFCLQMKQYTTAEIFFLETLKKSKGQETSIYYALVDIYKNRGDMEKEKLCLQKILFFDKNNQGAISSMQTLKSVPFDSSKAVTNRNQEKEAKLFFNRGNTKYLNGDFRGALIDYDSAIALKPDYYKAYNNRAIIKANELRMDKEALIDFNKAIELKTDFADAYLGRGTSKFNLKDYEGACNDWQKAFELGNKEALNQVDKYCK